MTREALMRLAGQLDEVATYATAVGEGAAGIALVDAAALLGELAIREAVETAFREAREAEARHDR